MTDQLAAGGDSVAGERGVQPAIAVPVFGTSELLADQRCADVASPGGRGVRPGRHAENPDVDTSSQRHIDATGERTEGSVSVVSPNSWVALTGDPGLPTLRAIFNNSFSSFTSRYLRPSSRNRTVRSRHTRLSPTWSRR